MKIHVLKLKLRKLHKYIGFTFSLFILHLTITGILLTYPSTFKIENSVINNYYILKKYNMDTYKDVYEYENSKEELIVIKNNIYINGKFIDKFKDEVLAILYTQDNTRLYVLTRDKIIIYIFEKIGSDSEIKDIITLSNDNNFNKLANSKDANDIIFYNNIEYFKINTNNTFSLIKKNNNVNYNWSVISNSKRNIALKYLKIHQGDGVSLIRILTELHNGKFFGSLFTMILFISSLSLIFLTVSSFIFATNLFKNKKK